MALSLLNSPHPQNTQGSSGTEDNFLVKLNARTESRGERMRRNLLLAARPPNKNFLNLAALLLSHPGQFQQAIRPTSLPRWMKPPCWLVCNLPTFAPRPSPGKGLCPSAAFTASQPQAHPKHHTKRRCLPTVSSFFLPKQTTQSSKMQQHYCTPPHASEKSEARECKPHSAAGTEIKPNNKTGT